MADQTPQYIDLTPEIINLDIPQGTDHPLEFQLTDNAGNAVDITNDSVKFTAKEAFGGDVTIATKTNGAGQHTTPGTGKTAFVLTRDDLTTDEPDSQVTWVYEIRRVFDGSNYEIVYIQGELRLMPSVGTDV
jgi:hypothetical protein